MFRVLSLFLLSLSLVLVTSCRTSTIYNVKKAPITIASERYTLQDVEKAILRAGAARGWQMRKVRSGHIVATLNIRRHMAQVDITYNKKTYNIQYKDSHELKYDGSTIHNQYNAWIKNLDKDIRVYLSQI